MGSFIELNDTLQITKDQGFPTELDLEKHLQTPFIAEDFADKIFEFHDKPDVRIYKLPPVRNFFVENKDGKWVYWGLVYILETTCDYVKKTTSGKFKILYINTPEEMKKAHDLIDRRSETQFFK
jgi:hypothetical protein